jgi:hypothetical protein
MTQIFAPSADTWLRLFSVGGLAALAGGVAVWIAFARSDFYTGADMHPATQPVPFSHKHHAGDLGIDCQYCHTSVADGPHAGLPPTHTCMTCHSQIWTNASMLEPVRESLAAGKPLLWHRVARLPDYVYFRHDVHIAKGVGCVTCHGRIDKMPLTYRAVALKMEFCLSCHRDPAPNLRPHQFITDMNWKPAGDARALGEQLVKQNGIRVGQLDYCYVCHR